MENAKDEAESVAEEKLGNRGARYLAESANKKEDQKMYVSRLTFLTLPGKTAELENELKTLREIVKKAGGENTRILRTHFASPDAPNVVFAQDASDLKILEEQIHRVTAEPSFQQWSKKVSPLLRQSPNREVYMVVD
jgi:hypothetical protein